MKRILPIFITSFLLIVMLALASVSSVTTSASATQATTGTSVTVTASVTASGSETGSISLVKSSGLSITDPASGEYSGVSLSSTPTSKTFTISAGTAGTYTYYASSGGVNSVEATIVYVAPSTITISGDSSGVTKNNGDTFTLSLTLENSQSGATITSYTLNLPSGYSASGDSTSATISVPGSSSTTLTWTITVGSSSGTITFDVGDNTGAFSKSVTVPSATSNATTTTTTTTTSTGSTTAGTTLKKTYTSVIPQSPKTISSADLVATDTDLTEVTVAVKERVTDVEITVAKLASRPASISADPANVVYRFIDIQTKNLPDSNLAAESKIKFRVPLSWFTNNSINADTVALYRYSSNQWNKLTTTKLSEGTTYVTYEATIPGFSVFAVAGESIKPAEKAPEAAPEVAPGKAEVPTKVPAEEKPSEEKPAIVITLTEIIIFIVIAGIVIFILNKKGIIKLSSVSKQSTWEELYKKYKKR